MSETPLMDALNKFISALRQQAHDRLAADLFAHVLPQLVQTIPQARAAHAYLIERQGLTPLASTQDVIPEPDADAPHQRVLTSGERHYDATQQTLILPLYSTHGRLFALIALEADDDPIEQHPGLDIIAAQLGLMLENALLRRYLEQRSDVVKRLHSATTQHDLLQFTSDAMRQAGQFVSLNLIQRDANDTITGLHVLTDTDEGITATTLPQDYLKVSMLDVIYDAEEPLYYEDITQADTLNEMAQQSLREAGVKSLMLLPLRASNQLYGFISLGDTRGELVPGTTQLQSYQIMADQIGITLENQLLLQQTQQNLDETRQLYELNRSLLQAHDIREILQILYDFVGHDARSVNLASMSYDEAGRLQTLINDYRVDEEGVQETQIPLHEDLPEPALQALQAYWERIGDEIEIVEDMQQAPDDLPLRDNLLARGVHRAVTIPIWRAGRRIQQISATWTDAQPISESARRLLRAVQSQVTVVLENQRLLREERRTAQLLARQVRALQAVSQLSTLVNTLQDEQALLDETARRLPEALDIDHVRVMLMDAAQTTGRTVAEYPNRGALGDPLPGEATSINLVRERRRTILVHDIPHNPQLPEVNRRYLQDKLGVGAMAVLPMYDLDDNLLGMTILDMNDPAYTFDEESIEVAETIVAQVTISLQKLRLLAASRRQTEQMQTITRFGQSMQANLELDAIFTEVFEAMLELVEVDFASIMRYEAPQQALRLLARYEKGETRLHLDTPSYTPLEDTLVGRVFQTRQTIAMDDLPAERGQPHPRDPQLRTIVIMPLLSRGGIIGVFGVGCHRPRAYNATDITILEQLANQLAVALTNAEAYQESQRLAQNKALANEISASLQEKMDLDSIMASALQELGEAIGARRGRIRLRIEEPGERPSGNGTHPKPPKPNASDESEGS